MGSSPEEDVFIAAQNPSNVSQTVQAKNRRTAKIDFVSFGLVAVALYGTALSGLFLVIAIVEPQYGHRVTEHGALSPSAASLLTAFLAKTIEISFATVYLVFLGQHVSRRATARGINLGTISMRSWILLVHSELRKPLTLWSNIHTSQPGKLISEWQTVRLVGFGYLGLSTIFATVLILLYTTAANTLGRLMFPWKLTLTLYSAASVTSPSSITHQSGC